MKIVTRFDIHPKDGAGGAQRQMELIGRELLKKDVEFNYFTRKSEKIQNQLEIINGIKVYTLVRTINRSTRKIREKILNTLNSYDLLLLSKYLRKFDFDTYHLRGASKLVGIWAFFARIIKRKKFVFTTAHIMDCSPGAHSLSLGRLNYKIYEYGLKRADVVITLAEYMKKALYQNYGVKSVVIKSGHPIPKGPFKKDDPPTILWISRLIELKKPEIFLQLAKALKKLNVNLILVGPGSYLKKEITEFANTHKNLDFIPGVPSGKDNEYYERASLLINTSIHEGYSNTFIQAWLRETPVVSLDVDPDCDICENGLGYHAKGDLNAMVNKIKEFMENPPKLKEMGRKCREYAIKNHDIKKTAEQHYKLYQWVLKQK